MKILKLTASILVISSLLALNPTKANATNSISIEQAKSIILNNGNYYGNIGDKLSNSNFSFQGEFSPSNIKGYAMLDVDTIIGNEENLYIFFYSGICYFVGVNSGKLYEYEGGTGGGEFSYVKNNKEIKAWYCMKSTLKDGWVQHIGWENFNDTWSFYKDGVMQTGWVYDNGKWYYFSNTGEMAHDVTIDGYYLGSDGAWIG